MEVTKPIGWITFLLGIAIIVFAIYQTFNIFTDKTPAPQIFRPQLSVGDTTGQGTDLDQQALITNVIQQILPIPSDSLVKLLNLGVWTFGAGILIFGGAQIAGLGIKLIKQ